MNSHGNRCPIVYVWLGLKFERYIKYALEFAEANYNQNIILYCSNKLKLKYETKYKKIKFYAIESLKDYNKLIEFPETHLNQSYRNGFWINTFKRLVILHSIANQHKLDRFLHAELDNIVFDFSDLMDALDQIYAGVFVPMDIHSRAIGSIIYVNDIKILQRMLDRLNDRAFDNDMEFLGYCVNEVQNVYSLPTESGIVGDFPGTKSKYTKNIFEVLCFVTDAAALGQYYFGIDKRISSDFLIHNLFKNENIKIDFEKVTLRYFKENNKCELNYNGSTFRLTNLHIHSKLFRKIYNTRKFNYVLNNGNKNKEIILQLNAFRATAVRLYRTFWGKEIKIYALKKVRDLRTWSDEKFKK